MERNEFLDKNLVDSILPPVPGFKKRSRKASHPPSTEPVSLGYQVNSEIRPELVEDSMTRRALSGKTVSFSPD